MILLTIGYAFKLSIFRGGDEILWISTILLTLGLITQGVVSFMHEQIKVDKLRLFFISNSLVLAISFLAIMLKTGHVGLVAIKHLTFDVFTTILLTVCLIYNFSITDRWVNAPTATRTLIHRHITVIFIFLVLSFIYMTLYSETTNRMDIIEMIDQTKK
jgi:hypothetical protein